MELLASADPEAFGRSQPGVLEGLQVVSGVGDVVLAVLTAYAPDSLARRNRGALCCLIGGAPVTPQSGRQRGVRMQRAANGHLRNAMHDMAVTAAIRDPASKNGYRTLRARGCYHGCALRLVADQLLRIMFAMRRDGTDFDLERETVINLY